MSYIQRLRQKIRYNSILRIFHDGLVKIGVHISLFYLVEEGLHLQTLPYKFDEFSDFSIEFLKEDGLNSVTDIPERLYKKEIIIDRIKDGSRCLLLKRITELSDTPGLILTPALQIFTNFH